MASSLRDSEVASISALERQRIAHDLHDGLGQLLGGIALKAQALAEALAEPAPAESADAAEIARLTNEALAHTRLLVRGLGPVLVPSETFAAIFAKLARQTERLFLGVTCRFSGDSALAPDSVTVEQHLSHVVQEAINNAIRHGQATCIEIELTTDSEALTLRVRDNGTGLSASREAGSGIGLRIMSHRVHALGGTFHTEAGADGGTVVRCRVPHAPPTLP